MSEKNEKDYIPNKISIVARLRNLILSIFFIIGGAYNLRQNDFAVIIGGGRCCASKTYHLHDQAAILMYLGLVLVSVCLISEIIDHYDKRNNEHIYHMIATWTLVPGIVISIMGLLIAVGVS